MQNYNGNSAAVTEATPVVISNPQNLIDPITVETNNVAVNKLADFVAFLMERVGSGEPGCRLSLSDLEPVADIGGGVELSLVPFKSAVMPMRSPGGAWTRVYLATSQVLLDVSLLSLANDKLYDVFLGANGIGQPALFLGPAWTNDSTRSAGTALTRNSGYLVNAVALAGGPGAQYGLYVGTIGTDGSAQLNDTPAKRAVWNHFNRVERTVFSNAGASGGTSAPLTLTTAGAGVPFHNMQSAEIVSGLSVDPVRAAIDLVVRTGTTGNVDLTIALNAGATYASSGFHRGSVAAGGAYSSSNPRVHVEGVVRAGAGRNVVGVTGTCSTASCNFDRDANDGLYGECFA